MPSMKPRQQSLISLTPSPKVKLRVDHRIELRAKLDAIKKELEELDKRILKDAQNNGGTLETDSWKVTAVDSENRHIQKDLLLAAGVKATVIAKCTKVSPYSYPRVTVKGKAGAEKE